jgi:acetyltransferase
MPHGVARIVLFKRHECRGSKKMIEIRSLDARGADAVKAELAALLADVVDHGASVGFLASLSPTEADLYWAGVRAAVVNGSRVLLVAWQDGQMAGTVQLDLCQRANGGNRAEVQKLIVHSGARRSGVASALMQELERQALALRRGLLYLDTEAGGGAEHFYRSMGYTRLGELPQFACDTAGDWRATVIYFKTLLLRMVGDVEAEAPLGWITAKPTAYP